MTKTTRSYSPFSGSNTRPPWNLSFFLESVFSSPSPGSGSSTLILPLPKTLSGQMYLLRWNSCSKMYSFRSARVPVSVLAQELPARLVNTLDRGSICTFIAMAAMKCVSNSQCMRYFIRPSRVLAHVRRAVSLSISRRTLAFPRTSSHISARLHD